jgi:hypothetical protein
MSLKIKCSALILSLGLLAACATPNASDTQNPADSSNTDSNSSVSVGTDVSVDDSASANTGAAIEAKSLTRTQFVKAMQCAQTKSTDQGLVAAFSAQGNLYADAKFEDQFNATMQFGGGAPYLVYEEAAKVGCTGA